MVVNIESTPELTNGPKPNGLPEKVGPYLCHLRLLYVARWECGWCGEELITVDENGEEVAVFAAGVEEVTRRECRVLNINPDSKYEPPEDVTGASEEVTKASEEAEKELANM
jgi:hypothetical protein